MGMKSKIHAFAGVLGLVCVTTFVGATAYGHLLGTEADLVAVKDFIFKAIFVQILALLGAGASGVSLLGKRSEPLADKKQKRGPIGFMTTLLLLTPCAWFLSSRADAGQFDTLFYVAQMVELGGNAVCFAMISLNIRDGLALRGRIAAQSDASTGASIERREGGPLVALRLPVLNNPVGRPLDAQPVMALCRCGASKNKPFCDGSHNEIGFDSTPNPDLSKDEVLVYEGKEITIHYNRLLCSHAAECGKRQKAAFDSSRKPWIVPDNASVEGIKEVVKACPSGALRYSLPGGEPQHDQSELEGIVIEKDGPYRVCGVPLAGPRLAKGAHPQKYVLCRCGASSNKPYCDGSHYDVGWRETGGTAQAAGA